MVAFNCICEIEGQRGFFQILLTLNEHQELHQSKLYNNKPTIAISNNVTASRALYLLRKYKLVLEQKKDGTNAKYYKLTEKGRHCAQLLTEIQKILEDEL